MYFVNDFWMDSLSRCHFSPCWMALMMCLSSRRLTKNFFVTTAFSRFSRAFLSSQSRSSFIFLIALLDTLPCTSALTLYSGSDIFCYLNVCSASYFSCTLQVNSTATVLLALVALCTVLAVKSSLFTDSERNVIKVNNSCSYILYFQSSLAWVF